MATMETTKNGFLDVTKVFGDLRMPGLDIESIVAIQRKNLEAFTQASQLAVQGARAVAQRQAEIVQQAIERASMMFRDSTHGSPEDWMAKNIDAAKQAFEQGVTNARELTELASKANAEAFNVISKRFTESLDDVRDYAKKQIGTH